MAMILAIEGSRFRVQVLSFPSPLYRQAYRCLAVGPLRGGLLSQSTLVDVRYLGVSLLLFDMDGIFGGERVVLMHHQSGHFIVLLSLFPPMNGNPISLLGLVCMPLMLLCIGPNARRRISVERSRHLGLWGCACREWHWHGMGIKYEGVTANVFPTICFTRYMFGPL